MKLDYGLLNLWALIFVLLLFADLVLASSCSSCTPSECYQVSSTEETCTTTMTAGSDMLCNTYNEASVCKTGTCVLGYIGYGASGFCQHTYGENCKSYSLSGIAFPLCKSSQCNLCTTGYCESTGLCGFAPSASPSASPSSAPTMVPSSSPTPPSTHRPSTSPNTVRVLAPSLCRLTPCSNRSNRAKVRHARPLEHPTAQSQPRHRFPMGLLELLQIIIQRRPRHSQAMHRRRRRVPRAGRARALPSRRLLQPFPPVMHPCSRLLWSRLPLPLLHRRRQQSLVALWARPPQLAY